MTMQTHTLTLTRWHKVAERLLAEMQRLSGNIEARLGQMTFSLAARATANEETVTKAGQEVEAMLQQHRELNQSVTDIRVALALANTKEGVSDRLATIDGLNRSMKVLTSVHTIESGKQHRFADYRAMEVSVPSSDTTLRVRAISNNPDAVKVKVLAAERVTEIDRTIQDIRRQIHTISDEIADINRAKLTITLPDVAAKVAGIGAE